MRRLLLILSPVLLGVVLLVTQAYANTALEISFNTSEAEPIAGAEFQIFRVSTKDVHETFPEIVYDAPGFEELQSPASIDGRDDMQTTAAALVGYIADHAIEPYKTGVTDTEGMLSIPDCEPGIYLVVSTSNTLPPEYEADGTTVTKTFTSVPFLVYLPENYMVEPKAELAEERTPAPASDPGLKVEKVLDQTIQTGENQFAYRLSVWNPVKNSVVKNLTIEDKLPKSFFVNRILSVENAKDPVTVIADDKTSFSVSTPELPYGTTIKITYIADAPEGAAAGDYVNVVTATDHDKLHAEDTESVNVVKDIPAPTTTAPIQQVSETKITPVSTPLAAMPSTGVLALGSLLIAGGLAALAIEISKRRKDDKED